MPNSNKPAAGSIEYRFVERSAPKLEDGTLSGRAAPFNKETMIGKKPWGFREKIAPGAFAKSINDGDVTLLDNHQSHKPIARQSAGTLKLEEGKNGLDWTAKPANTSYANDVRENAKAGNYGGCSFGFEVVRDSWHYNKDDDVDERTLHEVKLHEISVCTFPAYADGTSVSARDQVDAAIEARDEFYMREYLALYVVEGVGPDDDDEERGGNAKGNGKLPYGSVAYADPGYQKDGKKRYPIDTKAHAKTALAYISKAANAAFYSAKQLASIKSKILAACKKFGVKAAGAKSGKNAMEMDLDERTYAIIPDLRSELIAILGNSEVKNSERVLQASLVLARESDVAPAKDIDFEDPAIEKHVRKQVKKALKAERKVSVQNGAGQGDSVHTGDKPGTKCDSGHGLGLCPPECGGGENNPTDGNKGDDDNPKVGKSGPQVGDGTHPTGTQNNAEDASDVETRDDDQPDTSTDQDGEDNDATRYLRAVARKRRMQFDAE